MMEHYDYYFIVLSSEEEISEIFFICAPFWRHFNSLVHERS